MWMVDPKILCNRHLLGEHVELHMFVGTINHDIALTGYGKNGLVEVHNIRSRHAELVKEMKRRGMNHKSPLPGFKMFKFGQVNKSKNMKELANRCENCKDRINKKNNY
jgi:ribosomal protein L44E